MVEIARIRRNGGLVDFDPKQASTKDAKTDAVIDYAKRVKDWPTLEAAVDAKIADQKEFVRWWAQTVTANQNLGRGMKVAQNGATLLQSDAEELTGIKHQQVSRWRNSLKDEEKYKDVLFGPSYKKAMAGVTVRGTEGTGDNEWFTPPEYIDLARNVLGDIDLDPASHPIAQECVRALKFFTLEDNGLEQEWHGRVWLNPPYAQPAIGYFVDKLVSEVAIKRVSAAILLTHNYTDTEWFHKAAEPSAAICFTRGRIRFISPGGELAAPTQGQAFFYFGGEVERFVSAFSGVGLAVSKL